MQLRLPESIQDRPIPRVHPREYQYGFERWAHLENFVGENQEREDEEEEEEKEEESAWGFEYDVV